MQEELIGTGRVRKGEGGNGGIEMDKIGLEIDCPLEGTMALDCKRMDLIHGLKVVEVG